MFVLRMFVLRVQFFLVTLILNLSSVSVFPKLLRFDGLMAATEMTRGQNIEWYTDAHMISATVEDMAARNGAIDRTAAAMRIQRLDDTTEVKPSR